MMLGKALTLLCLIVSAILLSSSNRAAHAQTLLHEARYSGPGAKSDLARDIKRDAAGNIYVTGFSVDAVTGPDMITIKYSADLTLQWAARFSGPGNNSARLESGHSLAVDAQGNVYVAGVCAGSGGRFDLALVKYDPSGQQVWVRFYNGPGDHDDERPGLALDPAGNVYVACSTWVGSAMGGEDRNSDYATMKYAPDGTLRWVRLYNGPGSSTDQPGFQGGPGGGNFIVADAAGSVYVTGGSYSGYSSYLGRHTGYDVATVKYDTDGVQQWVARYDNPGVASQDSGHALALGGDGYLYVTGHSYGATSRADYVTLKYDPATGSQQWAARYDGPVHLEDRAYAVVADANGFVYVTGGSAGAADGNEDCVTIKYDATGNQSWVQRYNGPASAGGTYRDTGYGIGVDKGGNVFVTGMTIQSAYQQSLTTFKYDSAGNPQWIRFLQQDSAGYAVAVDEDLGDVYVAGLAAYAGSYYDLVVLHYAGVVNRAPTAADMSLSTDEDTPASVTLQASDPDGDSLSFVPVTGPAHGTLTGTAPHLTYHPAPGWYGTDSFTYKASDGKVDSNLATVTITVQPVNDLPTASAGTDQVLEGTGVTTPVTLTGSGSDPDGDTLTFTWSHGASVLGNTASLTVSLPLGVHVLNLTVDDGYGGIAADEVIVTIRDTTAPTITAPAPVVVPESDPLGTPISLTPPTVTDICDPSPSMISDAPALFPLGETTVTWKARDASGNQATATQQVSVAPGSPSNQLSNLNKLISYGVASGQIDPALQSSLSAKVEAALEALARGDKNSARAAMGELSALVNQVEAQSGKKIERAIATQIIERANRVIASLGA